MTTTIEQKSFYQKLLETSIVGGVGGIAGAVALQPMLIRKTMTQQSTRQNAPIKIHKGSEKGIIDKIRFYYRGLGGVTASFAPTIVLQTTANEIFSSKIDPLSAALGAGIVSSIFVTPSELIMIYQANHKVSFRKAVKEIHLARGLRGFQIAFISTAGREALFATGYLVLPDFFKIELEKQKVPTPIADFGSKIIAGVLATVVSHPFDTHKTHQQTDFSWNESLMKNIFNKKAFAGISWRLPMVTLSIAIVSYTEDLLRPKMGPFIDSLKALKV